MLIKLLYTCIATSDISETVKLMYAVAYTVTEHIGYSMKQCTSFWVTLPQHGITGLTTSFRECVVTLAIWKSSKQVD